MAKGFPEDEPLLRTGHVRDSIECMIVTPAVQAEIGSNSDIAVYQKLGTSTIPARPFLAGAAAYKGQEVADVAATLVASAMAGKTLAGEVAKLAVEALKEIGRTVKDFAEDDDEQSRNK